MIPRIFHWFWDGPPCPPEYLAAAARWLELHPGWGLERWDDARFQREAMSSRTSRFYREKDRYSPRSNLWQWRTNLARLEILERFGGVWVDADLVPLRSIEPLMSYPAFAARESPRWVNNAFLGFPPGHPLIVEMLAGLPARIHGRRTLQSNRVTGPHYLTERIGNYPDVAVLPSELIYPYRWDQLDRAGDEFPDAYTVHRWNSKLAAHGTPRPRTSRAAQLAARRTPAIVTAPRRKEPLR